MTYEWHLALRPQRRNSRHAGKQHPMTAMPFAIVEDGRANRTLPFHNPARIFRADSPADLAAVFAAMEQAQRDGLWLAGYAAYELGYALEPKLTPLLPQRRSGPLLCFGAFAAPDGPDWTAHAGAPATVALEPDWSAADYARRFEKVVSPG